MDTALAPSNRLFAALAMFLLASCDSPGGVSSCRTNCDVDRSPLNVDAGDDIVTTEGSAVELLGSASQQGGFTLTYRWQQLDGLVVEVANANMPTATFFAPFIAVDRETLVFQLTVTSSNGVSDSDVVEVIVEPAGAFVASLAQPEAEFNDVIGSAQGLSFAARANGEVSTVVAGDLGGVRSGDRSDADRIDVFAFTPPETGAYSFNLCRRGHYCTEGTVTGDYHLSLLDQFGNVLAERPAGEFQAQTFSASLQSGLPYYAVVASVKAEAKPPWDYRLTIVSD